MENNRSDEENPVDDKAMMLLKKIIQLGIEGGFGLSSARELGEKYLQNPAYSTKMEKIDALARWEERKNFTSG